MRLWSLHPQYLDAKGLVALWREALLAKAVLSGQTNGYRQHPQLARFKAHPEPLPAINAYLEAVYQEALSRRYRFDGAKVGIHKTNLRIPVTKGQMLFEWQHLQQKLTLRSPTDFAKNEALTGEKLCLPLFEACEGEVEPWERGQ